MGWRDRVKLVGKPTKRFRVWRIDVYGKPYACEGDYDTVQALTAHRWVSDALAPFVYWLDFVAGV
jgi:hypothetical protein